MKTVPKPRYGRNTLEAILVELRDFFNQDGRAVAAHSVHPNGFTFSAGVFSFALELSDPELLDWEEHSPHGTNYTPDLDWTDTYIEPEF